MKGLTQRIELMLLSLGNVLIILGSKERNRVGGAMLRVCPPHPTPITPKTGVAKIALKFVI